MRLSELAPEIGSRKKRKRIGRGVGSGHGKTSCKGHKGQKARTGGGTKAGFEGGQMPLQRRIPKRGFTSTFQKEYFIVNIGSINNLSEAVITPEVLLNEGLIKNTSGKIKILGKGEVTRQFSVKAHAFSASAREKISKAQGSLELI
ncbi:MAG: 50S ribosomal protein L15 [Nitrospirota bacterium]